MQLNPNTTLRCSGDRVHIMFPKQSHARYHGLNLLNIRWYPFPVALLFKHNLSCGLHKVCSPIMARSDLLCGLHNDKVCSHIMVRSDLFLYFIHESRAPIMWSSKSHMYALGSYFFEHAQGLTHAGRSFISLKPGGCTVDHIRTFR